MVRKASRTALKAAEKTKNESPKNTRNRTSNRRRKSSSSSEEDNLSSKNQSPKRSGQDSSDTESLDRKNRDKPFKKRGRSSLYKDEAQTDNSDHRSRKGRNFESPTTEIDSTEQKHDEDEFKEDRKSKGKSKGKNKSNFDTSANVVDAETENVQVTDQSPNTPKDPLHIDESDLQNVTDNSSVREESQEENFKNGEGNVVHLTEIVVTELTPEDQLMQMYSEQTEELVQQITIKETSENMDQFGPQEIHFVDVDKDDLGLNKEDLNATTSGAGTETNLHDSESVKEDSISTEQVSVENHSEKNPSARKIKLKRPPSESQKIEPDRDNKKEENGTNKKKITLKRCTENRQVSVEDHVQPPQLEDNELSKDTSQAEEWSSTYETDLGKEGKQVAEEKDKPDNKPVRRRISLKRATVDEKKSPPEQENASKDKDGTVERRASLQETNSEGTPADQKTRRHSTAFERPAIEIEGFHKPQKPLKKVRLVRNLTYEPPPPGEGSFKKIKWGKSELPHATLEPLNVETLKQVCPAIEFLKDEDVNLEIFVKERKISEAERRRPLFVRESEDEEMTKIEAELTEEPVDVETRENIIAMNRKISIVDDTASKMRPPPSPAKNPTSEVLFITNLVRPFTVKQLKELLERTGKIREEGFWTDRIKSKCYVYYESAEEAEATRNALHGVNWPIGNGKKLVIDYATVEDLEKAKNPPLPVKKEKSPEKENKKPVKEEEERNERKSERAAITREWDVGKEEVHRRRSRSRSRERGRKHSRKSYTPEGYHDKKRKREEPVPQKAMDDLFLKTKATPSIYWQPLSPEEIALKQQQRQVRMEEHKRRMDEVRTSGRGAGGGGVGGGGGGAAREQARDRGRDRNFRRR